VPATPIAASTRYYRPGTSKIYFCSSIANKAAPTRGELNAGTDISPEIGSVGGWAPSRNFLAAPDLVSDFVPQVAGSTDPGDATISMYSSSTSVDARSLLPIDTVGFIVLLYEGDVAGRKMNVFPVRVGSDAQEFEFENVAMLQFSFAITSAPARNVTIPA
jgi:hypothetical protein